MQAADDPHHALRVREICLYRRSRRSRFTRVLVTPFTARGAPGPFARPDDFTPGTVVAPTVIPARPGILFRPGAGEIAPLTSRNRRNDAQH